MTAPVEVTTRYVTTVDDLASAWAFVMDHLDHLDRLGPDPEVHIKPIWIMNVHEVLDGSEERPARQFEVVVSGMVQADV